jgi:hypothetical protein
MSAPLLVIRKDVGERGSFVRGTLEGMPKGVVLPEGYLSHQLWRIRTRLGPGAHGERGPEIVMLSGGIRQRTTTGAPLVVTIRSGRLGMSLGRAPGSGSRTTLRAIALPVVCLTAARKLLEDRSIFVGSRVVAPSALVEERIISELLAASCGAYKVTECADAAKDRIIRARPRATAAHQLRAPIRAFELLVSGPTGWTGPATPDRLALERRLARRVLGVFPVESVTTELVELAWRGITVVRLRCAIKRTSLSGKALASRAALASVLTESVVIPALLEWVTGQRLGGPVAATALS